MLHILRAFFDALPSVAGILLATLAFALVFVKELDEKLKDKRKVRWAVAVVLSIIGVSGFMSDLVQRSEERTRIQNAEREQKQAVDGIKEQLHQSEIQRIADVKYLQGKLDVFAQFAPAIVKLAQATEYNTRKQYEQKVLTDKQLRDLTADVVKRMRTFATKHSLVSEQIFEKYVTLRAQLRHEKGGQGQEYAQASGQLWQQENQEDMQEIDNADSEFRSTILGDAVFVRDELLRKLGPQPTPPEARARAAMTVVKSVFNGGSSNARSVADAATYLEQLANKLSP